MRILFSLLLLASCSCLNAQSNPQPSKIAPSVQAAFSRGEQPDVLVVFKDQKDVSQARSLHGKEAKSYFVYTTLLAHANQTQTRARQILRTENANSLCVVNAIAVQAIRPEIANQLAALDEIAAIALDPNIAMPMPTAATPPLGVIERNAVEWGIEKISAPSVWAMGFRGQGISIGGADTGYDWQHPAIQPHYRGWNATTNTANHNYNWHDAIREQSVLNPDAANPCGFDIKAPCDDQNHGTHTMGTMTGDDNAGNQIGVAPAAQWVGCRNMERGWGKPSSYIECFEWFLAPTDTNNLNPNPSYSPHVINNSWYCAEGEGCTDLAVNEVMRQAVINLKLAGVVVVVSNGNFGGQGCNSTYGPPAYFEESFSVGSTMSNDTISGFSSRGPVTIDNSNRVKPNVSAPGSGIRSSIPGNQYAWFSGTSMAGPHVAGMVALILSAAPELIGEVETIEDIIESTCVKIDGLTDCSDNGGLDYPNNTYGFGRIDALAAVTKALIVAVEPNPNPLGSVRVFPNPATDAVNFVTNNLQGPATLVLMNAAGQVVQTKQWTLTTGQVNNLSLQQFPKGVYFWQIQTSNGVESGRLVKQ